MEKKTAINALYKAMNVIVNDEAIKAHLEKDQEIASVCRFLDESEKNRVLYLTYTSRLLSYLACQAQVPYYGNLDVLTVENISEMTFFIEVSLTISQINVWWFRR